MTPIVGASSSFGLSKLRLNKLLQHCIDGDYKDETHRAHLASHITSSSAVLLHVHCAVDARVLVEPWMVADRDSLSRAGSTMICCHIDILLASFNIHALVAEDIRYLCMGPCQGAPRNTSYEWPPEGYICHCAVQELAIDGPTILSQEPQRAFDAGSVQTDVLVSPVQSMLLAG